MVRRFLLLWLLAGLGIGAASAAEGAGPEPDPRLGPAFARRERPILGSATAPIVVIEVSSFRCAHCRDFHEKIFPVLRSRYVDTGKVQWVVLNASDDPSEQFAPIFQVARCALRQEKYWEVTGRLFEAAGRPFSFVANLVKKSPQIDGGALDQCLDDRGVRNAVAADFAEYARLKLQGTPTFLIRKTGADGRVVETTISGAQTLDYFQRVVDELLKTP